METFNKKSIIVSGAALGMGNLITREFAADGGNVLACDVNSDAVRELAAECANLPGRVVPCRADVLDFNSVCTAAALAEKEFGGIDILINFAGGAPGRVLKDASPFWERKPELLDFGIDVNLRGALYFDRAVFPCMMKHNGGVLVNIGSISGVTGSPAVEYSAAKAGMEGLTKSLAIIGAPYNIRCVCVIPGPVLTRPEMARMTTLQGRAAEPAELTGFIRFLCSDNARSITGSSHLMDCGRACGTRNI